MHTVAAQILTICIRPKPFIRLGSAIVIVLLSIYAFDLAYSSRIGVGLDTLAARIPADPRIAIVLGYSIHFAKSAILGWLLCSALCFSASLRPVAAATLLSVGVLFFAQFTELFFAIKDHKWHELSLHLTRVGIFFVAGWFGSGMTARMLGTRTEKITLS